MTKVRGFVVPPKLFKLFEKAVAHKVTPAYEMHDHLVFLLDEEGHVHKLEYFGRLIDEPNFDGDKPVVSCEEHSQD